MRMPPHLPGGLPFVGHAVEFGRDPVGLLSRGRERYGDVYSFDLLGSRMTVLTGPNANKAFFQAADSTLSAREAYGFTVPIFGAGVAYDVSPEIMGEQLAWVFPALREERLHRYAEVMLEEAQAYVAAWPDEGEIDLLNAMNELTVFIAARCLIGPEFRQHLSTEFAQLYHDLEGGINLLAFFHPYLPLPSFWRRDHARQRMGELISRIVADRRATGFDGEDFLQTLMEARYKNGSTLPDQTITGLLLTLIFAGQHTSAVLAAWTGLLLLDPPASYLNAVLAEQETAFGDGQPITLEALRGLVVLERSIKEAERMHPPLVMLMRKILSDFEYDGYTLRAGGLALVSPGVSHRIAQVFADADRYDPDRFAPGREEDRQSQHALIGFGGGRHRCVGKVFAYQQIAAIWSVILQRFELSLASPMPRPNYRSFVVGPDTPRLVRFRRRVSARGFDRTPRRGAVPAAGQS
ncbi:MAG: cytochrome P450 [Chloroflexota bacterium]